MFAVFSNKSIVYLGDDRDAAMAALESKDGSTLKTVSTLTNLVTSFSFYLNSSTAPDDPLEPPLDDELSDAVNTVLDKLDEAGITAANAAERLKDDSKRAMAEVRSLGIKGMNAVGEGFMALGELLQKAQEEANAEGSVEGAAEDNDEDIAVGG